MKKSIKIIESLYKKTDLNHMEFNIGENWIKKKRGLLKDILVTPRITRQVILKAANDNIKLILSIFPPVFCSEGKHTINITEQEILKCIIENEITIFSFGKEWLTTEEGGIDYVFDLLKFDFNEPYMIDQYRQSNKIIGRFGHRNKAISFKEFLELLFQITNEPIDYFGYHDTKISSLAIITENIQSREQISVILKNHAFDLVIFSEISYDVLLYLKSVKISYIQLNQRVLENICLSQLRRKLTKAFTIDMPNIEIMKVEQIGTTFKG